MTRCIPQPFSRRRLMQFAGAAGAAVLAERLIPAGRSAQAAQSPISFGIAPVD
jgi:hypothetical protein